MDKIRLIAFDLDGTLLTTDKRLTEYTRKVLERASKKGIELVPSTGRPYMAVPEVFFHFPGMRYMVTSNGARIMEIGKNTPLFEDLLPFEKAKQLLDICKKYDTMREVFYDGRGYTEKKKEASIGRYVSAASIEYMRMTRVMVEDLDGLFRKENRGVDKMQALFADQEEKKQAFAEIRQLEGIEASAALSNNIEVNGAGVHKGAGLLRLGKMLSIAPEEMLAFGDGSNDIRMLVTAGTGVAVANAAQAVKDAADELTLSNDEDGVAAYIEKCVLD